MDARRVGLLVVLLSLPLLPGCLGADVATDGPNGTVTSPEGGGDGADASNGTPPTGSGERFTASGLPRVAGVGDGAAVDLDGRVLWLNETDDGGNASTRGVIIDLTSAARGESYARRAAWTVRATVQHSAAGDRRIEPDPVEGGVEGQQAFATMRGYLADAMRRTDGSGLTRHPVHVVTKEGTFAVTVGNRWSGGPVIDPDDPPHTFQLDGVEGNASVRVRLEGHGEIYSELGPVRPSGRRAFLTVPEPGNYTVEVRLSNGSKLTGEAAVTVADLGDCNAGSTVFRPVGGERLASTVEATTRRCVDPADRSG